MKVVAHIKLDKEIKLKAQKLAEELGFGLSTIINAQLKQFVRDGRLVVSNKPLMSYAVEQLLEEIEEDIKKNKKITPPIRSKQELERFFGGV